MLFRSQEHKDWLRVAGFTSCPEDGKSLEANGPDLALAQLHHRRVWPVVLSPTFVGHGKPSLAF